MRLFLKRFIALCHASCQLVRTVLGVNGEQDRTCVIRWCNASEDKASRRFLTFPKRLTPCRAVTGSRRRAVIKHGLAWCGVVTLCRTVRRRNYINIICLLSHQFPSLRSGGLRLTLNCKHELRRIRWIYLPKIQC